MDDSQQPRGIKAFRDRCVLEIVWANGEVHSIPFKTLRGECPCAGCADELTGIRTLDVNAIPDGIAPTAIELSGNYALRVEWSDGHSTGLYTWRRLAEIGKRAQAAASAARPNAVPPRSQEPTHDV
jgi:DUF971 family protein